MDRRYLISDVLAAMENGELKVFYQPKYDDDHPPEIRGGAGALDQE